MISGTAYGVVLNDQVQLDALRGEFLEAPYKAPPSEPVLYIKSRNCFAFGNATVRVPQRFDALEAAATVGLLFSRDVSRISSVAEGRGAIGAACLALDVCVPHSSYYRPPVTQRCRDGFLPLGAFGTPTALSSDIVTCIDGREVHRWSIVRLARSIDALLKDISSFMTLRAGDLLLVGLPGDAPQVRANQHLMVQGAGLPALSVEFALEQH